MSDLDQKEQTHVRAALRFLNRQLGTWAAVAESIRSTPGTLKKVMGGRDSISASMALRVARLLGVMMDDLLVGRFLPPGACQNCGHVPAADFKDESTVVEAKPRAVVAASLSLVQ